METLERTLATHPFFEDLSPEHMALITGCAQSARFDGNTFLFKEGEEATKFYLIRDGAVALELCPPGRDPLIVQTLTAGDIIGWSWLVAPHHWRFDARALMMVRAFVLDGECLRRKCDSDPRLGYELLKRFSVMIAERLEATRLQLLDIYGSPS
jgi:CRP-like cAMP-binding protein